MGRGEAESRVRVGVLGERRGITEPDYTRGEEGEDLKSPTAALYSRQQGWVRRVEGKSSR